MRIGHFILSDRYVRLLLNRQDHKAFAYYPPTRERVDLKALIANGERCEKPPGPLGPRPIMFSVFSSVKCWMPEEDWPSWRRTGKVRYGQFAMIKAIEEKICELEARSDFPNLLIDPELESGQPHVAEWIVDEKDLPDDFCPETEDDRGPESYWSGGGRRQTVPLGQRVAPALPWGAVGEHLPEMEDNEVEIAMIGMQSVMGDVLSIRAERHGDTIRYYVIGEYDEYDERDNDDATDEDDEDDLVDRRSVPRRDKDGKVVSSYKCKPDESSKPLTLGEVKDLLWSISREDYGQIFKATWIEQFDDDSIEDYENDFFYISSDFYQGLQGWLRDKFEEWKRSDY
jgi:hypothetical protein